ncbi:MAG: PilZ domain-containing protein [Pseudomonadota bacterium]
MRRLGLAISLAISAISTGTALRADCALIDRIDQLHTIQLRLARDPDTALFATDIRQLRSASAGISNRDAVSAVDGNSFTGHGADVVRFLANTQQLLQSVSLDDPQSVRPHFDRETRENLSEIGAHLTDLRCNAEQIAIDAAVAAERGSGGDSDAEDLAEVAETLNRIAEEVLRPRTFFIALLLGVGTALALPVIRRQLLLRKRRAKRHNTTYETLYTWNNSQTAGMLIDINCHGTKLRHEADDPLPVGEEVDISICDNWVGGTVMWSNTHYSGVQFRRSIALSDVETVCATKAPTEKQNGAPRDAASQKLT